MRALRNSFLVVCLVAFASLATGCVTHAGSGALAGSILGASAGALIGHAAGDSGAGALIGGGTGLILGGLLGQSVDSYERGYAEGYGDAPYDPNAPTYRKRVRVYPRPRRHYAYAPPFTSYEYHVYSSYPHHSLYYGHYGHHDYGHHGYGRYGYGRYGPFNHHGHGGHW